MADQHLILDAIVPVILLLAFGVVAVVLSRGLRLSPIVGYLVLGIALAGVGRDLLDGGTVATLAELGVVFLLFDIGLHFSFTHMREQAADIFGFGPLQVALGTLGLGALGLLAGLPAGAAFLVGATLALSSTAVVARIIAERHQQNCPVGLTATAILIFQDVAAIFILIVAGALGTGAALLPAAALALAKAALAFAAAVLLARVVVRPLFDLIARTRNEEVFTAMALLVALSAGWATGALGLSLTLGAFLGGMILADTPYRAIIQSEIKPFRGLLLGFFFISVGLGLDLGTLARAWPAVIAVAAVLVLAKVALNALASLAFRWSVPGSTQLGFLLSQGSEFAFVILSLPPVRALVGEERSAVLIAAVALTLALTPTLAEAGRTLAGHLRRRRQQPALHPELVPRDLTAPVLIVGMGRRGRTVADGLGEFGISYAAIERDDRRLREAIADGYTVLFGDMSDPKIWEPVAVEGRRISVLTEPSVEVAAALTPVAARLYPNLARLAAAGDAGEAAAFAAIGLDAVVDPSGDGLPLAADVLARLGVESAAVAEWARRQRERTLAPLREAVAA